MITKEYFANYKYLESLIKSMRRRLKYFEQNPLTSEHGVVKGSSTNFPYTESNFVISSPRLKSSAERENLISQLEIDLAGNARLFEDMKLDIETFIESTNILSLEERTIMRLRYVDQKNFECIGEELGYDRSVVSRKLTKTFEKIESDDNEVASRFTH